MSRNLEDENRILRAALQILSREKKPSESKTAGETAPTEKPRPGKPPAGVKLYNAKDPDWKNSFKWCARCGKWKPVTRAPGDDPKTEVFGIRFDGRDERPQPYCNRCRSITNYHVAPRKYRTSNGGPGDKR